MMTKAKWIAACACAGVIVLTTVLGGWLGFTAGAAAAREDVAVHEQVIEKLGEECVREELHAQERLTGCREVLLQCTETLKEMIAEHESESL